ncbi:ribosomal protein S7 domain-containing protein [Xylariaceae sp. FL0255]|nr:ribosomal protein S7 domain-containing protein [Xylariaceae sp. FL0255]
MTSKLNPWSSLRGLTIRTRPLSRPPTQIAAIARRKLTTENTTNPPDDGNLPPPSPPSSESQPIEVETWAPNYMNAAALEALRAATTGEDALNQIEEGFKFHRPERPAKGQQLQDRHSPVVKQLTRLMMKDGKLSQAQRHLSLVLQYLRTAPPPKVSPLRPLLPGAPPPEQLPLNPLLYLELAIDSVAPVIRVRNFKGIAGGGAALEVPEPLDARARRRIAINWIMDIVNKKKSTGSGRKQFAHRFGQEIVAVVEGRSAVWDKRQAVHALGTSNRANLTHPSLLRKRK